MSDQQSSVEIKKPNPPIIPESVIKINQAITAYENSLANPDAAKKPETSLGKKLVQRRDSFSHKISLAVSAAANGDVKAEGKISELMPAMPTSENDQNTENFLQYTVEQAAYVKEIGKSNLLKKDSFLSTALKNNSDCLHLIPEFANGYVDNLRNSTRSINVGYGDEDKESVLKILSSENSPLSTEQRHTAEFYTHESEGFRLFRDLNSGRVSINPEDASSISAALGIEITLDQWNKASEKPIYSPDQIPVVMANLSRDESISEDDRKKLQAEVIGCVKAMEVTSNQLASQGNSSAAVNRKESAGRAILNLIDQNSQSIYSIIKGRPDLLLFSEIQKIYNDRSLRFNVPVVEKMLLDQNSNYLKRADEEKANRETKALTSEKNTEQAIEAVEKSIAETTQESAADIFLNPDVQTVLGKIDYTVANHAVDKAIQALSESNLTGEQSKFCSQFIEQIKQFLSDRQVVTGFSSKEIVDSQGGPFGFGRKTHTEHSYTSSHSEIKKKILELKNKQTPDRKDQIEELALEELLNLPEK